MTRRLTVGAHAATLLLLCRLVVACDPPDVEVLGKARKICQLTGEEDASFQPPQPTPNRTVTRAKLRGTDLGTSFRGPFGTVFFFFGDSSVDPSYAPPLPPPAPDAVAYARADENPEQCTRLTFFRRRNDHAFLPAHAPLLRLGIFEVPTGGFFANGNVYVFFANEGGDGDRPPTRSYLARNIHFEADDPLFEVLYEVPARWMLNVSPVLVNDALEATTAPTQVLFFGSGKYRDRDQIYLAKARLNNIEHGDWQYFGGLDGNGVPTWQTVAGVAFPNQDSVGGLFKESKSACTVGEFSVAWNPFIHRWLMFYQCNEPPPGSIVYRVARHPWGPWSSAALLFDPIHDGGICQFIHSGKGGPPCPPGAPNPADLLIPDVNRPEQMGAVYAPYIVDAYTNGNRAKETTTVYFAMSTWNPYQVVLMRADLAIHKSLLERVVSTVFHPDAKSKRPLVP